MEGYQTEQEQIDSIKKWWKENGSSIVSGVLLGLAVIFGGRAWFEYRDRNAEAAAHLYVQFMDGLAQQDEAAISKYGDALVSEHSASPYAALAALGMAKQQIERGEPAAAQAQLRWAMDHAKAAGIQHSARLRLVRMLIAQQDLDGADALLQQAAAMSPYEGLYHELRGDVALARADHTAARAAYTQALDRLPLDSPARTLVQTKLDNVAVGDSTL